jgi:putative tricarboxylic transport membrane protein
MKTVTHKYQIIPIFVWIGLALFVMILSYQLGLGGLHNPGPGLMPFLLGCFLCITSFYVLLTSFRKREERGKAAKEEQGQIRFGKLCLVLASLFAYPLLLERLGYLITTLLILIILFRSMSNRWSSVLLASVLTVLVSYLIFTYLGIRFPKGILKGL